MNSIFAYLLMRRIIWHIFDTSCPTYTLNMINQVINGKYPASFPGAPDIPANYHQGHIFLSAGIGKVFNFDSLISLRITILIFSVFGFWMLTHASAKSIGSVKGPIIILACYLITSFPTVETWPINLGVAGWYEYVSLFEYLVSPSWPVSLFICIWTLLRIKESQDVHVSTLILLIVLPFFNATLFTLIFVSYVLFLATQFFASKNCPIKMVKILRYLLFSCLIYFAKNYMLSAFLNGEQYESPRIIFRLTQDNFKTFVLNYMQLQTPLIFFGLYLSVKVVKRKIVDHLLFFSYFLVSAAFFPLFFEIKNVSPWDNSHKFVIAVNFAIILLLIKYYELHTFPSINKKAFSTIILLVCFSLPSQINLFETRLNSNIGTFLKEQKTSNLSNYFTSNELREMLWFYSADQFNICASATQILDETDVAAAGFYASSFLLSENREKEILADISFASQRPTKTLIRNRKMQHVVVVPMNLRSSFEKEPRYLQGDFHFDQQVDDYFLYKFK
jgi:hypothetical protein